MVKGLPIFQEWFKDFENHVLHVRDGYWGGAPDKAESWYGHLVSALKGKRWGEAVWAAITSRPGAPPAAAALTEPCRKPLSVFKVPQKFLFIDAMPRTSSGKIRRVAASSGRSTPFPSS